MLTIRSQQLERMNELREEEYLEELVKYFRARVPDLVKWHDDAELRATIAGAARKARGYGIRSGEGVVQFVGLALAVDPKFDEDPAIRRFLSLPEPDIERKIQWLIKRIGEKIQEAVAP